MVPEYWLSDYWLCTFTFLFQQLRWTWHLATKQAQRLPSNFEELKRDCLHRIAALARAHKVTPDRFNLADETFVFLHPATKYARLQCLVYSVAQCLLVLTRACCAARGHSLLVAARKASAFHALCFLDVNVCHGEFICSHVHTKYTNIP